MLYWRIDWMIHIHFDRVMIKLEREDGKRRNRCV